MEPSDEKFDVAVIGGGVNGISAAYQLSKRGIRVAILEKFTIGNTNGSSHGVSRIIRCAYQKEIYRDLAVEALKNKWPQIENELGTKFIEPSPLIGYYSIKKEYDKYLAVAESSNGMLKVVEKDVIKERYPTVPYVDTPFDPIVDSGAGIVLAEQYIAVLRKYLLSKGNVVVFEHAKVVKIISQSSDVLIETETEQILARKVIVTCGKWVTELYPSLSRILKPKKLTVIYLQMDQPEKYVIGRHPTWWHHSHDGFFCSLPDIQGTGVKFFSQFHDHPDLTKDQQLQILKSKAKFYFGPRFKDLLSIEECFYTCTKTDDFIIDWIDEDILLASVCSGHAFKFAPLTGQILADLVLNGKSIPLYEQAKLFFSINYHTGINLL